MHVMIKKVGLSSWTIMSSPAREEMGMQQTISEEQQQPCLMPSMTGTLSPYIEVILEISLRIIHRIVAEKGR